MQSRQHYNQKTTFNPDETIVLAEAFEAVCNEAARAGVLSESLRVRIAQHVYDSAARGSLSVQEIVRHVTDEVVRPVMTS